MLFPVVMTSNEETKKVFDEDILNAIRIDRSGSKSLQGNV